MNENEKKGIGVIDIMILIIIIAIPIAVNILVGYIAYSVGYTDGQRESEGSKYSMIDSPESDAEAWLRGIDVSSYQKENYKKLIDNYADDFVICKATDGTDVDPICDKAYQYAKSKGKLLGVYFFGYPKLHDAKEYAQFCAKVTEGYVGEAIFILDCERHPTIKWISVWVKEFERLTSVKPLVYSNLNKAESLDWTPIIENGNPLWLAYYYTDDGEYYDIPDDVGEWPTDRILVHQYTTAGLGGESESLDLDVFFGDKKDWQKLAKVTKISN